MSSAGQSTAISSRAQWKAYASGLLLRVALLSIVNYSGLEGDERGFRFLGLNLCNHHSYGLPGPSDLTCIRPPFYPLFLALHFLIFGDQKWPVMVSQSLIGLTTVWLAHRAIRLKLSQKGSDLALWLLCLCPFDAIYFGYFLSETVVTCLLMAVFSTLLSASSVKQFALAGVALGLACLTRDGYILLLAILPAYLWIRRRTPFRCLASLVIAAVITISPWTLRNHATFGKFIPVSRGNLGFNLWVGTWERDPSWQGHERIDFPDTAFNSHEEKDSVLSYLSVPPARSEERDAFFRRLALNRLSSHPGQVFATCTIRAPRLWIGTRSELFKLRLVRGSVIWWFFKVTCLLFNLGVLLLASWACLSGAVSRAGLELFVVPVVYTQALYFFLHSTETRYSQPVYPYLLIFAALTLQQWRDRREG